MEIKTYKKTDIKANPTSDLLRSGCSVRHVMDRDSVGTIIAHVLDRVAVVWTRHPVVTIKNEVGSTVGHVCC